MSSSSDVHSGVRPSLAVVTPANFCQPNISPAGKRRRRGIGYGALGATILLLAILVAIHAAWYWRALVFLPAALAAISLLQVRRNTCVARAAEGTFEHDDFSKTPAPADQVVASRRVAAGIRRDAAVIGIVCGAVAAATALVF